MVLVNMPVMLGKNDLTNLGFRILENGQKASTLNAGGPLDPGEFEAGGAQVDHADETWGDGGFFDELGEVDHPRGLDPAVVHA